MTPFEFTTAQELRDHYKGLKKRTAYHRLAQIVPRPNRVTTRTIIVPPRERTPAPPVVLTPIQRVLSVKPTYTTDVQPDEIKQYSVAAIVAACAMAGNVQVHELKSCRRARYLMPPRFVACYLSRKHTKHGLPAIGKFIGKDHSTVLYAIRKVEAELRAENETFISLVRLASAILEAASV